MWILSISSKLGCPLLDDHIVFTGVTVFFSDYLVLPDIFLFIQYYFVKIPVHDQLNPDVLRDMKNDETYVFDSEVCQECFSLGMAIVIFIVKQSNLIN